MSQQKSEDRVVPEGLGNLAPSHEVDYRGGGKAIPVMEAGVQLMLPFATAATEPRKRSPSSKSCVDRSSQSMVLEPKANIKSSPADPTSMEEVIRRLPEAFRKVAANKGAPGPDRQSIHEVGDRLWMLLPALSRSLLNGSYQPGDVRRVWIPKGGGKQRGLGIPNVVDRMVQEAVRQVLEPLYEPTFHPSSHGFRPGRGCQTAIAEARAYVAEGYPVVVDMDLEQFFDRVHHQRLLSRLAERVSDKRLLSLIGRMLKAQVVMPDGLRVATEEGLPQGGPLSPLLSNIVLDELDRELARRGHRFVRYADDANIYVRSHRAGERVLASITSFLCTRLRLRVNAAKSAVATPDTRHFLGYRLAPQADGRVEVLLSARSEERLQAKVKELTPRNCGCSLATQIERINQYLRGWLSHFGICTSGLGWFPNRTDAHIRRRLRAIVLKQWKRKRTIARNLIQLGVRKKTAWRSVYDGRKSIWPLSHSPAVDRAMPSAYFAERGLVSLKECFQARWDAMPVPVQLTLFPVSVRP